MTQVVLENIKAIAFDLDGTLVDSAGGLTEAIDKMLDEHGFSPAGKERVSIWVGNGGDVLVDRALTWAGATISAELQKTARESFAKYYAISVTTGSELFPQVKETLDILAQNHLPMAIVTNKPTPFIAPLLKELAIDHYFSLVLGGNDVKVLKPHPAPLYLVMGQFGLHKEELLFVGDSRNDIIAAQSAGCPSVGLTYGYNYGESIALSEPDCVLTNFSDLLPTIGLAEIK